MEQKQTQVQRLTLKPLTAAYEKIVSRKWDKINSNPRAFYPRELDEISLNKIRNENIQFGESVLKELNLILQKSTSEEISRRLATRRKIVIIGYGQGYDSSIIELATLAGYEVWIIDISEVACNAAEAEIWAIWEYVKSQVAVPPIVNQAEISSVLIDPSSIDLDLDTVEGWYLCRTLFALSKKRAKWVLQMMAQSLKIEKDWGKHNWIYLTNPLQEDNPQRLRKTSIVLSRNEIISNLRKGAGCDLQIKEAYHPFFSRNYTSMIIKAG